MNPYFKLKSLEKWIQIPFTKTLFCVLFLEIAGNPTEDLRPGDKYDVILEKKNCSLGLNVTVMTFKIKLKSGTPKLCVRPMNDQDRNNYWLMMSTLEFHNWH